MNRKSLFSIVGAIALLLGMGMNVRHSLNDYGLATNKLAKYVTAQDSYEDYDGGSNKGGCVETSSYYYKRIACGNGNYEVYFGVTYSCHKRNNAVGSVCRRGFTGSYTDCSGNTSQSTASVGGC